ncbi:hypothetical protein BXZ70DRAFT_572117 [Cristinia sonorae]|uniref:Uncharacterized protein n=1 Tax=Cristinia sonorae TaxID=1940300 RepID=A0A8K0UF04_9AGAR|nr:hypothetical protein BXZ70DRAFT_572117 [Cristinia sonorae]
MRDRIYLIAFFAILFTFTLNVISVRRNDWVIVKEKVYSSRIIIKYGLFVRCERSHVVFPLPGDDSNVEWSDYQCRPFPRGKADRCDVHQGFCNAWVAAGYLTRLSELVAVVALLAIVLGSTIYPTRRGFWKVVAGLTGFHATLQLVTFWIIADASDVYTRFDHSYSGAAYAMNTISWVVGSLTTIGFAIAGIAADRGQSWAAGHAAYQSISG